MIEGRRTRVKFCGIGCGEDVAAAVAAGGDALGFVFYPPAEVAVTVAAAAAMVGGLPPFVTTVALFVNAEAALVEEVVRTVRPNLLQFHGDEEAGFCTRFGVPYVRACRVRTAADIAAAAAAHPAAVGILADAFVPGRRGGTGARFDWGLIPRGLAVPLIVAGGLTAENVGGLVREVRPFAVDVSGGVAEMGCRRRKNFGKMRDFVKKVAEADGNE